MKSKNKKKGHVRVGIFQLHLFYNQTAKKNVMKKFNLPFILILFALTIFTSCQDEVIEVTEPSSEETLAAGSSLAENMMRTAARDGSWDNIIDGANCLSIELPVTVVVNGVEIIIDSEADYDVIESIFDEFDDDNDVLEIQFPVVIILSDYSEISINSYDELEVFIEDCSGENEVDDDIECIDFVYPITISIYNSNFQVIDTVVIQSDEQLYYFIEDLDGGVLASINFPVTMVLSNGDEIVVNNNAELEAAIETADGTCDEDDDNDYNDDDIDDCDFNLEGLYNILSECTITSYLFNPNNELEDTNTLDFEANAIVVNGDPAVTETGLWGLGESAAGYTLTIEGLQTYMGLNNVWTLQGCEDGYIYFENDGFTLKFDLECVNNNPTDCTELDVDGYLQECVWNIVNFNGDNNLIAFDLDFMANQGLVVTGEGLNLQGTWSTSQSANGGVEVVIDGIAGPEIQAINGSWVLVECDSDRLKFTMGDNYIIIEQDCSTGNNSLGCLEAGTIVMCDENNDGIEVFNLYEGLSEIDGCTVNSTAVVSYHTSLEDAENNTNPLESVTAYTNISNPQTIYIRIELFDNPSEYEILEIGLALQDCSNSGTLEDLQNTIIEGYWIVASYIDSGDNNTAVYSNYNLNFNSNGSVVATDGGSSTFEGTWEAFLDSNSNLKLLLNFGENAPFDEFNDDWLVIDLQIDRIELYDLSGGDGTEDFLVFERI